jgi:large subunit ribosomal protein L28
MAYMCDFCGKSAQLGNNVSHANNRTRRKFKPNLQRVRAIVDGSTKRVRVCTDCIKGGRVQKPIKSSLKVD